jgi:ribosomal protein S18 acetylase RimI-like enzyme
MFIKPNGIIKSNHGYIEYYKKKNLVKESPNDLPANDSNNGLSSKGLGLIVFMGSYVDKEYRGKGCFTEMFRELMSKYPTYTIQVAIQNPVLISFFKRNGFEVVPEIEIWGNPSNCTCLQKTPSQ